jgi:hypothetical protein
MIDALLEIRNALNIQRTDFFLAYGMPSVSRQIVKELVQKGLSDVAAGLCLTTREQQESSELRTKIYTEYKALSFEPVYDKVLCFYNALPRAFQDLYSVVDSCLNVCMDDALVLVLGIPATKKTALGAVLAKRGVKTFWYLSNREDIGVLIKKEPANAKRAGRK